MNMEHCGTTAMWYAVENPGEYAALSSGWELEPRDFAVGLTGTITRRMFVVDPRNVEIWWGVKSFSLKGIFQIIRPSCLDTLCAPDGHQETPGVARLALLLRRRMLGQSG